MKLPALPAIAVRILERIFSDDCSAGDLASDIECDPALTAQVLKVVNSAAMGLRYEVTSVQHAVALLGLQKLRPLIFSMSILASLQPGEQPGGLDRNAFWRHSIATAAAARMLARRDGASNAEEAYIAGLIHDLGKLILDQLFPRDYALAIEALERDSQEATETVETRFCGISHTEIGERLGREWRLPERLCRVMARHHHPSEDALETNSISALVQVVAAADYTTFLCGYSTYSTEVPPPRPVCLDELLGKADLNQALGAVREELEVLAPLFAMEDEDPERWQTLLVKSNDALSRMASELESRNQLLQALNRTLRSARSGFGRSENVPTLLTEIVTTFGFDRAWLWEVDRAATSLTLLHCISADPTIDQEPARKISIGADEDPSLEAEWRFELETSSGLPRRIMSEMGARSAMMVSVQHELFTRFLFGCDLVIRSELPPIDREILQVIAIETGLLHHHAQLLDQVKELAVTDPLTRLANRRSLMESLRREAQEAHRTSRPLAIAIFDIDRFKLVNDRLGHQRGDALLVEMARILRENVRAGDIVGRYGGEEFVIVLPSADLECAQQIAQRVCDALRDYGVEHSGDFPGLVISTSGGVADYHPEEDHEALLGRADAALYEAKNAGRNRILVAT